MCLVDLEIAFSSSAIEDVTRKLLEDWGQSLIEHARGSYLQEAGVSRENYRAQGYTAA